MLPVGNEESKTLCSRMRLIFDSPWPLISAIPGKSSIDSITEVRFSGRVATTISRSPMVSLLRLALPASCAFSTPEMSEILFSRASPNLNPTSNLVLP